MDWQNEDGYKSLFELYYNVLCNFAWSIVKNDMDAEDVVVDVFANLWKKRKTLNIDKDKLKSYLFSSVKNSALQLLRARSQKELRNERYGQKMSSFETDESLQEDLFLFREALKRSVRQLSPKTKEVYLLRTKNGLTFEEIADRLSISRRTAENHMANAIKKLRILIKDNLKFYD